MTNELVQLFLITTTMTLAISIIPMNTSILERDISLATCDESMDDATLVVTGLTGLLLNILSNDQ